MAQEQSFAIGDNVHYQTNRGGRGAGKITGVTRTLRGDWYVITTTDGTSVKVRRAGLVKAKRA